VSGEVAEVSIHGHSGVKKQVYYRGKRHGTEIANRIWQNHQISMLYEIDQHQISDFTAPPVTSSPANQPSDEELMERIQARDERGLEMLIKRYNAMLRSVVGRMIANDQDVTDVVEEVFLGVWNQASNFDVAKGRAMGWIITIARRRAIDRVRRRQAYNRAEMNFRLSTDTGLQHIASDDVEQQAESDDNAAMFAKLIPQLPEAQQQVVRLAFYGGLSQRDIARKTALPLGTVKTRLELGIRKLRAAVCAIGPKTDWLSATA
jgi:RNA polymerase sigma-70 factor (ECF subfamily)